MFSTFDCTVKGVRGGKEDAWNAIIAGFMTGGTLAFRSGPRPMLISAIGCGVLLGVFEGVGHLIGRVFAGYNKPIAPMCVFGLQRQLTHIDFQSNQHKRRRGRAVRSVHSQAVDQRLRQPLHRSNADVFLLYSPASFITPQSNCKAVQLCEHGMGIDKQRRQLPSHLRASDVHHHSRTHPTRTDH